MQQPQHHTQLLPVAALLLAATLWGIFWIPLRWLEGMGLDGLLATFLIYSGTIFISIPVIIRYRTQWRLQPGLLLLIMISSGWCNTAFILAILDGEILRVILLFYLSPVWATILARLVLKEQLTTRAYVTLCIALVGALLILWHEDIGYPWPQSGADWMAISSGFAFALTNLFVHMAGRVGVQTKTVAAWLGVILLSGVALLVTDVNMETANTLNMFSAVGVGFVLMTIMTVSVVYGVTHMPVHRSAIILLFEVVAAAISSYLLTDERLGWREVSGGLIVVLAAYLAGTRQQTT